MILILVVVIFGSMLVEARRASANERAQRDRGGVEPPGDVYRVMSVVYPVSFLAMLAEGWVRGAAFDSHALAQGRPDVLFWSGVAVFATAKTLKWWAIVSLGSRWTFRVIVVPGAPLVAAGPYRLMRHPNYVGVVGELAGTALMTGAVVCGPVSLLVFGALLVMRIRVEERALGGAAR